jgi:hypothetical protein
MEEYDDDDHYLGPSRLGNTPLCLKNLDICIASASAQLESLTGRVIPRWRSTLPRVDSRQVECDSLGIQLPIGPFFYPCSGDDDRDAVSFFHSMVSEFYFSDPFRPLRRSLERDTSPSKRDTVIVEGIGNVVNHIGAFRSFNRNGQSFVSYQKDGVLTLLDHLPFISIFYYRGDSSGEGGSDQHWGGPVLLDLVLSRILNGGIICCDESNAYGPLFQRLKSLRVNEIFNYRNLNLRCLSADIGGKKEPMMVWRVTESDTDAIQ